MAEVHITWDQANQVINDRANMELKPEVIAQIVDALFEAQTQVNIDPTLLLAIMEEESGYNMRASSSSGARGLMQILPSTGKLMAKELFIPKPNLHDPVQNVKIGSAYLANLRDYFEGNMPLALSAYNVGPARIRRLLDAGKIPRLKYANKILNTQTEIKQSLLSKGEDNNAG